MFVYLYFLYLYIFVSVHLFICIFVEKGLLSCENLHHISPLSPARANFRDGNFCLIVAKPGYNITISHILRPCGHICNIFPGNVGKYRLCKINTKRYFRFGVKGGYICQEWLTLVSLNRPVTFFHFEKKNYSAWNSSSCILT